MHYTFKSAIIIRLLSEILVERHNDARPPEEKKKYTAVRCDAVQLPSSIRSLVKYIDYLSLLESSEEESVTYILDVIASCPLDILLHYYILHSSI